MPLPLRALLTVLAGLVLAGGQPGALRPAFSFDPRAGLSGRVLTPNGDGLNDYAVFVFSNPRDAAVSGRIYDLRGALVAELAAHPALDPRTARVWDGRRAGQPVPPGVYVWRLEAEERAYAGTLVVLR